jgi:hypothetical protein
MTIEGFRRLALSLPETSESAHRDHPDFRVSGKIFATLGYPDAKWGMVKWGMVKLTPPQQGALIATYSKIFEPVSGGWGICGATQVRLRYATATILVPAMAHAWQNTASTRTQRR